MAKRPKRPRDMNQLGKMIVDEATGNAPPQAEETAFSRAYSLGLMVGRLRARELEFDVGLGRNRRAKSIVGGKTRSQRQRDKWPERQDYINQLCESGMVYESAVDNASRKFKLDVSTIKRSTVNPNPRQKKSVR